MKMKRLIITQGFDATGEREEFTWDMFPLVDSTETAHLDDRGLPKVGTQIREGMIVVGKWGKTKGYDERGLPTSLELHGLPKAELIAKFGHFWKVTAVRADASMVGVVASARLEPDRGAFQAIVEIQCPE